MEIGACWRAAGGGSGGEGEGQLKAEAKAKRQRWGQPSGLGAGGRASYWSYWAEMQRGGRTQYEPASWRRLAELRARASERRLGAQSAKGQCLGAPNGVK